MPGTAVVALAMVLVALPLGAAAAEGDDSSGDPAAWDYRTLFVVWDADAFDWRADWNDGPSTLGLETILDAEGSAGWELDSIVTEQSDVVVGSEATSHEARRLRLIFRKPLVGGTAAPSDTTVSISGFAFQPPTLEVTAGSTVSWTNDDAAQHTVTSADGTFDSGTLGSGAAFSHTFGAAGSFAYSCLIHPTMTGEVVVA
jgi:plastocyanin